MNYMPLLMALSSAEPAIDRLLSAGATGVDPLRAAAIGSGTLFVLLLVGLAVGLGLLFRRRGAIRGDLQVRGGRPRGGVRPGLPGLEDLALQAGAVLVRADDAVESAENEVDFALAQFGADRTRAFADAVTSARGKVAEAFRLKQQLDDAYPESQQQRRDLTKRVIALGESAQRTIEEQSSVFTRLRRSEADSPARLAALREGIGSTRSALASVTRSRDHLVAEYAPAAYAGVAGNVDAAAALLDGAMQRADDANARISQTGVHLTSAATTVSADIDSAASVVHDARLLLSAVEAKVAELQSADSALAALVSDTRVDLVEARRIRDSAPDAETGSLVVAAVAEVEGALGTVTAHGGSESPLRHPVNDIVHLGAAVTGLDTALAGARNQSQRLEHAQTALVGALVAARSQIGVTKSYLVGNRAGIDTRTRLAEAERQLLLAEAESNPVEALDAARRAATAARDADALARYSAL